MTTNYLCNEWLDDADKRVFETMKKNNPRRYAVAGLGNWGIVDGLVFENWKEELFVPISRKEYEQLEDKNDNNYVILDKIENNKAVWNFGYTNDPTALFCGLVGKEEKTIWVFDELYEKALTNRAIVTG